MLCRVWRDLLAGVDGAKPSRDGPPLVRAVDDRGAEAVLQDPGQAKQEGGDSCGALHP